MAADARERTLFRKNVNPLFQEEGDSAAPPLSSAPGALWYSQRLQRREDFDAIHPPHGEARSYGAASASWRTGPSKSEVT